MLGYVARRLLWTIPVLWIVLTISFLALHQAYQHGLDLRYIEPQAVAKSTCLPEEQLLGGSLLQSYLVYLKDAITFHWGTTTAFNVNGADLPVRQVVLSHFTVTLRLAIAGFVIAVLFGIPLGALAGLREGSILDRLIATLATVCYTTPPMVMGILMLMFAAGVIVHWVHLSFVPVLWEGEWQNYIVPSLVLGLSSGGFLARLTRSSTLEVLSQDYVRTARAKGLPRLLLANRHVMRNSILPVIAALGQTLASVLAGSLIIEYVFMVPGTAHLLFDGVGEREYPVVLAAVMVYTLMVVLANLLADLVRAVLDPRVRLGE